MCDVLTAAVEGRGRAEVPHPYGGQAVIEGVMMRGRTTWAVAVRRPTQGIHVERHDVGDPRVDHPLLTRPVIRGVHALFDSLAIGVRALAISARLSTSGDDEPEPTGPSVGRSMWVAAVMFIAMYIVLPTTLVVLADRLLLGHALGVGVGFHLVESVVRIVVFLAYLSAIGLVGDIQRIFELHGAEHQTITAWEQGEVLEPTSVGRHPTVHLRCGTNFLVIVMLLATVINTAVLSVVSPSPGGLLATLVSQAGLRVLLLPVIAGLSYEILRRGAQRPDALATRIFMAPGLTLQRVTTRRPDDAQREVAIRALEAVVPPSDIAGRVEQAALPSRLTVSSHGKVR